MLKPDIYDDFLFRIINNIVKKYQPTDQNQDSNELKLFQ